MEDIIEILQDTLHYPEFAKAYEALDKFRKDDLETLFDDVIKERINDAIAEFENDFDSGFKLGKDETLEALENKFEEAFNGEDELIAVIKQILENEKE